MTHERFLRVGCAGLPPRLARKAYFEKLHFLEDDTTFFTPPDLKVIARWRKEAAPSDVFAVHAWQLVTHDASAPSMKRLQTPLDPVAAREVGGFRPTARVAEAWARSVAGARAVGAKAILLETPPAFTPSAASRDALRRFSAEVATDREGLAIVWDPRGMWEPRAAAALAEELGFLHAWDPLAVEVEDTPPPVEEAYFRLHGMGLQRNRISDSKLEALAVHVEGAERAWVVFANAGRWSDARRFLKLIAELSGQADALPDDGTVEEVDDDEPTGNLAAADDDGLDVDDDTDAPDGDDDADDDDADDDTDDPK